ncbi:hypothetical protein CC80DRAFT_541195 [Byssothecium circinans]|uniref:Uncharacterized protein n=1 Tax=Byssothecium circinans TaxID=147558 RepID=A0A6A5UEB0_9PLEO|nr:hypothetical protein CC80DRAFT_541195 [Byssothecium circinans]
MGNCGCASSTYLPVYGLHRRTFTDLVRYFLGTTGTCNCGQNCTCDNCPVHKPRHHKMVDNFNDFRLPTSTSTSPSAWTE